jgi:hypothetical protein
MEKKALFVSELLMAGLCVYRFLNYRTTGFIVPDEYGYYYTALNGTIYGDRWFFGGVNIVLFRIFRITTPDSFSYFLPFYLFLWSGMIILVFYSMMKLLGFSKNTIALSLLSSLVLISFVLLSLGFLTESLGLCMAMLGIYCLLRFAKSGTTTGRLLWPLFASLFLGFAGGTREPYVALEIGGILLIALTAIRPPAAIPGRRFGAKGLALFSILLFVIPSGFLLYANTATTSQVAPLATGLVQSIFSNPVNTVTATTSITTITNTVTKNATETVVQNGQTTTTIVKSLSTVTSTATSVLTNAPFYGRSLLLNMLAIFVGGLFLGWGPIAFAIGLVGFVILFRRSLRGDRTALGLLAISLFALGSYFVVSYIFSPIPTYLTAANYSTIIRFSDTALPAFFLTAPFFFSIISKSRRRIVGLLTVVLITLLLLVPVYQGYALSNLGYTSVSPFGLDYRSPAVQVRDYVSSHQGGAPFQIIGVPYGWFFTPGISQFTSVEVYSPSQAYTLGFAAPVLNYTAFVSNHWTEFYICYSADLSCGGSSSSYVAMFLPGTPGQTRNQTTPFKILNSTAVISNPDFQLIKVDLSWP